MNGFINNKVLPPIMKFVNTRAMTALKNGMLFAMPFIIVGSIFLILANIPIPPVAKWLSDNGWSAIFTQAFNVSFGILAIWAAVGIGYSYVKEAGFGDVALQGGLTSLCIFHCSISKYCKSNHSGTSYWERSLWHWESHRNTSNGCF